ncbi:flagellar protein FlaG [Persephonella sp.]
MDIKSINNMLDKTLVQGGTKSVDTQSNQVTKQNDINQQLKEELKKLDKNQIESLLKGIKEKFDYMNKYLKIEIDKDLQEPVIKIIDKKTNEVVRQIPPEYLLELAKRIDELVGLLFRKEV